MKSNRIQNLTDNFSALLAEEQQACEAQIQALIESIKLIQGDTADRRFHQLIAQLKTLQQRFTLLIEMSRNDYLVKIRREAEASSVNFNDGRIAQIITSLMTGATVSLNLFCERLLDCLIETTAAERGFILFYVPESTAADVIAARNFQTHNLALDEYNFSRTLLREVFERNQPLLVDDASSDPNFSKERSVIAYQLKSVLVAPLKQNRRAIGAIYLENNSRPCAFDESELQLLGVVADFAVFCLEQARLLPVVFATDSKVFLDESRAGTEIIGRDAKMIAVLDIIHRIADSPATVLIEGESGTGKELIARALHYQSARRPAPFVAINCAAIPENLLESELFGHEKGAFTGATEKYIGRLEQANGGTIFFDEVSELAYPMQAKLLRFLQANEFNRLGGKDLIHVDARIVAATSKDLRAMTDAGAFQEALYYRLNVIPVRVPPLGERRDDIALLIDHFLEKFSAVYGKTIRAERGVYERLKTFPFRGNVRELENLIHRLVALAWDDSIRVGDLPKEIFQVSAERVNLQKDWLDEIGNTPPADLDEVRQRRKACRRLLAGQELELIERVVQETGGNLTEAANRLGVNRVTLHKILRNARSQSQAKE
jgi:Nif-specific regulatory protein